MTIDAESLPWWKKTVVYQIYPRSFKDSTGDGIGDLKGIISKLDYIKDLGVETIWFSPFYKSPTWKPYKDHDCGYDISDYRDINPEYGNMDDTDLLIEEVHKRGMKIVLDLVMNHTSSEHEWFKESRSSRDNPKRDWYIWRDGKKPEGKKPPNNWDSMIAGSPWTYDPATEQYYYHEFLDFQPDLNFRNPEVQEEMLNTIRFWLKKGVDGYRLDIINALFEDEEFRDAPFKPVLFNENNDKLFKSGEMNLNHPDTLEFCKTLRKTIDEFDNPPRFMVGEVSASIETLKKYLGENADGLNLIFAFQASRKAMKAEKYKKIIEIFEKEFPEPFIPTWVFGNHDLMRRISRYKGDMEIAKLNAALQLVVRGVPFIYYGEEIGMENVNFKKKNSKDAITYHFSFVPQFLISILRKYHPMIRDECRTPMQWDDSENAGFSPKAGVETWLPVSKSYRERNVKNQEEDIDSLLHCYKRFLKIRKENPALNAGDLEFINLDNVSSDLLTFKRSTSVEGVVQTVYIFLNFSKITISFKNPIKNAKLLVSTTINSNSLSENGIISLNPWEGIVIIEK